MQRIRIRKHIGRVLAITAALFVLGTAMLGMAGFREHIGTADVGLVLGSKVERDGTPSARLQARLDRTLELYRAGWFPTVIVSGGSGQEGYDEAAVMRDYLVARGIPPDCVILDSHGNTTFLSAQNTLAIVRARKLKSVFVVSQYFHLPRARLALERCGVTLVYSARAHFCEGRDFYSLPREVFGYLNYFFRRYDANPTAGA